jgi:hypothetical protein
MDKDSIVTMHEGPFRNRESVLAEIRYFGRACGVVMLLSLVFLALGIISDASNSTLVLEPMSWFLMAIFCMVGSMGPRLHVVVGKHFLGIEAESKEE